MNHHQRVDGRKVSATRSPEALRHYKFVDGPTGFRWQLILFAAYIDDGLRSDDHDTTTTINVDVKRLAF